MPGSAHMEAHRRRAPPPRFQLRRLTLADASCLARLCADPAVARMTARIPHPYRIEHAEGFLAEILAVGAQEEVWGIEIDFENGPALAGTASLSPGGAPERSFGYWVGRPFWGRGLATAACGEALRRAFADPSLARVGACVFQDNTASRRVLEKPGFQRRADEDGPYPCAARGASVSSLNWVLSREAWTAGEARS